MFIFDLVILCFFRASELTDDMWSNSISGTFFTSQQSQQFPSGIYYECPPDAVVEITFSSEIDIKLLRKSLTLRAVDENSPERTGTQMPMAITNCEGTSNKSSVFFPSNFRPYTNLGVPFFLSHTLIAVVHTLKVLFQCFFMIAKGTLILVYGEPRLVYAGEKRYTKLVHAGKKWYTKFSFLQARKFCRYHENTNKNGSTTLHRVLNGNYISITFTEPGFARSTKAILWFVKAGKN